MMACTEVIYSILTPFQWSSSAEKPSGNAYMKPLITIDEAFIHAYI